MIEKYEFGLIVIDGEDHTSDVIVFPERVQSSWRRHKGHELCLRDLSEVLEAKPEVVVVGTGASGLVRVDDEVKEELNKTGIELVTAKTGEACEIYNGLAGKRRVVAALHLTC